MKRLHLQICSYLPLTLMALSCSGAGDSGDAAPEPAADEQVFSAAELGDYSYGVAARDMRLFWRLRGDSIDIKLTAPTKGWLAVGFNPDTGENMKGANLLIGRVQDGKAEVVDHYGTMKDKHKEDEKIDGQANVTNVSGSEVDGETEVEFTVPLDSGDAMDKPLSPEDENTVLLAYGRSDRIVLKHTFRAILTVNLSTGQHKIVRMR